MSLKHFLFGIVTIVIIYFGGKGGTLDLIDGDKQIKVDIYK